MWWDALVQEQRNLSSLSWAECTWLEGMLQGQGGKVLVYLSKKIHLTLGPCTLLRSLGALPSTLGLSPPTPVGSVPLTILKPAAMAPSQAEFADQIFFLDTPAVCCMLQRCSHTTIMVCIGLWGLNCEDHLVFKPYILQEKN